MPTSPDSSVHEEDHDTIAHYENQESDGERDSLGRNEDAESGNDEQSDARRIDPSTSTKHVVRREIPKLNTERLKGPKGVHTIEKYFEGFKFHGKGHEKADLDRVMKRIEHWGHRLFPKLDFDDFLEKVQKLGTKKDMQVFIKKYRQDMIAPDDDSIEHDIMDVQEDNDQNEPIDEFEMLITEQLNRHKQAQHEAPVIEGSTNNPVYNPANENAFDKLLVNSTNKTVQHGAGGNDQSQLSEEVRERIERNRQQAIQRKLARQAALRDEANRKKLEETASVPCSNDSSLISQDNLPNNSQNLGVENCDISQTVADIHEA